MRIALVNFKGSVGKTTTALNLSAALIEEGKSVTLWDMDESQSDLSDLSPALGLYCVAPHPSLLASQLAGARSDYHLIECPPRLDAGTTAALQVADLAIVPVECEFFVLRGLGRVLRDVGSINASLPIRILITKYSSPFKDVRNQIQTSKHFQCCKTVIPRHTAIAKAPAQNQSVLTFAPESSGARAYRRLAKEVLTWS